VNRDNLIKTGDFEKVFLGQQVGIGLNRRGGERCGAVDPHVCFTILTEANGNWFVSCGMRSSYWFKDLTSVTAEAIAWCTANCEPDVVDGKTWGWRFK
jgi:hypothetical protein